MIKHSEEFKQEAVRIALTSGLSFNARETVEWEMPAARAISLMETFDKACHLHASMQIVRVAQRVTCSSTIVAHVCKIILHGTGLVNT